VSHTVDDDTRTSAQQPVELTLQLSEPASDELLEAVLDLSRSVSVEVHQDEVVHRYVERFRRLFPQRMFCVRLLESDGLQLAMVYGTGKLRAERRERIELSREALALHGIEAPLETPALCTSAAYQLLFAGGVEGFDVPLLDAGRVVGALAVEYSRGVHQPAGDRSLVVQLSVQLSAALHNGRLHRESLYLRDYLSKLLDHANAPIMVMGADGSIGFVNRAFLAVTGFRREELLGKEWLALLPEAERGRLLPVYISALHGEASANVDVRLPRRDGSFAQVAVNTASILSADGDIEGVIYIYRDVTELRELEEQVIHAEKLATLGKLAAGIVHELNNPLTSISVYGDYLLKRAIEQAHPAKDVERLRRITGSAERILKFTRDLVSYARPSTERPTAVDVHEVIDQAVEFCEHLIDETGAEVDKRYDLTLPPVYCVKGQLVQVFVNLVTNACHALPLGAGRLQLQTTATGDGRLLVRLTDNGKGIPEDNLRRVFEPFFTTKGEGMGTGLGLSIVKNILDQHRATISVTSEVGAGTTFEVSLACRPEPRE
jgi:PAS domain S-box-containing protein